MTPEEEADEENGKQIAAERIHKRKMRIAELNDQLDEQWVAGIDEKLRAVEYNVDPLTYRDLFGPRGILPLRTRDVIRQQLTRALNQNPAELAMMLKLNSDLSNADDLLKNLRGYHKQQTENKLIDVLNRFFDMKATVAKEDGEEGETEEISGQQIITYLQNKLPMNVVMTPAGILKAFEDYANATDEQKATDDNLILFADSIKELPENVISHLIEGLQELQSYFGPDFELDRRDFDEINGTEVESFNALDSENALQTLRTYFSQEVDDITDRTFDPLQNTVKSTISNIANNPIYQFNQRVKTGIKNPLVEMVKGLAGKVFDGKELADIEEVLNNAMTDFNNIQDTNDFTMDEVQIQAM